MSRQTHKCTSSHAEKGWILRSTGSWYKVRIESGEIWDCKLRGKFKLEGLKSTNPIAVGDQVCVTKEDEVGFIREILPRENYILRKATKLSRRVQVICANIDQALILFTLDQPVTTLGYIDRLLVSCEAYHIPVTLVFNKLDLYQDEKLRQKLKEYIHIYSAIDYAVVTLSAVDQAYQSQVEELLKGHVSVVIGRSGAGKSSIINLAAPELAVKIGEISDASGRGRHTTTYAEMLPLPFGGYIIDSPGFKEMELYDIQKNELSHYFPEMQQRLQGCKFNNCLHTAEPGCAIKAAVDEGEISPSRYHTYLSMLDEVGEDHNY